MLAGGAQGAGTGTGEGGRPARLSLPGARCPAPLAPAAPVGGCLGYRAALLRSAPRSLRSLPPPARPPF